MYPDHPLAFLLFDLIDLTGKSDTHFSCLGSLAVAAYAVDGCTAQYSHPPEYASVLKLAYTSFLLCGVSSSLC